MQYVGEKGRYAIVAENEIVTAGGRKTSYQQDLVLDRVSSTSNSKYPHNIPNHATPAPSRAQRQTIMKIRSLPTIWTV